MPASKHHTSGGESEFELSRREQEVLRLVVRSFVATAGPVGSRYLARHYPLKLSPASIRNTMSDLEEYGYLNHPHTSAGRIPTELGYRKFVDELMEASNLSAQEKLLIRAELDRLMADTDDLFREGSRLLGRLSDLLGFVLTPKLTTGVLERLELVPLSGARALFVVSVRGGMVRTIIVEIEAAPGRDVLDRVIGMLNERLVGLTLQEIRNSYEPRLRDIDDDGAGVIRLILSEASNLFQEVAEGRQLRLGGAKNIFRQPEFQDPEDLRRIIELIDDENDIIQLLEDRELGNEPELARAVITIGSEHGAEKVGKFSVVTARYQLGGAIGTVGVMGPTRMDYSRIVGLVESVASILSGAFTDNNL